VLANFPAEHFPHPPCPYCSEIVPIGQDVHKVLPVPEAYLPGGHKMHLLEENSF
jgi:hypothetical protein